MRQELEIQARRRHPRRPKTVPMRVLQALHGRGCQKHTRQLTLFPRAELRGFGDLDEQFPKTRADCKDGPRPCPWVRCRHHTYLDVTEQGGLKFNFPDLEVEDMPPELSCTLDIAERSREHFKETGHLYEFEDIGKAMGLSAERARQILLEALEHVRAGLLKDYY